MRKRMMLLCLAAFYLFITGAGNVHKGAEEESEIILQSESLRECVYEMMEKEPGEPLYERELTGCEGSLRAERSFGIESGDDLDFVRRYFDLDTVYSWNIAFPPRKEEGDADGDEISGWSRQQLEGLGCMEGSVYISALEDTVPACVLPYFTGAGELVFDVLDATGKIPEGQRFPGNVKSVFLNSYSLIRYRNLLRYMEHSQVEEISVNTDNTIRLPRIFLLDQAAGMESLHILNLDDNAVRAGDQEKVRKSRLSSLQCRIDRGTDLALLMEIPSLKEVSFAVSEEMDLALLLSNKELALRLRFCREAVEFEEDVYGGKEPVGIASLDEALGWRQEMEEPSGKDPENFLAIYQRCRDEGREIECFTIRRRNDAQDSYNDMENVRTFFRVTDGERKQILVPEREDSDYALFGDYRRDYFQMEDINFDGVKDITLDAGGFGNQQARYEFAWIWEPQTEEYVRCESYREIMNPSVDREKELIWSSWRNSAASHGYGIYRYEDGEFVLKRRLTETLLFEDEIPDRSKLPEGARVWRWEEETFGEDGVAETRTFEAVEAFGEKRQTPGEYEEFFQGEF